MTKNEKALDALCLAKFGRGFFDLPDLTNPTPLFEDGYSAQEVFDVCCKAWIAEMLREYPNIAIVADFVNNMTVAEKREAIDAANHEARFGWLHDKMNERKNR